MVLLRDQKKNEFEETERRKMSKMKKEWVVRTRYEFWYFCKGFRGKNCEKGGKNNGDNDDWMAFTSMRKFIEKKYSWHQGMKFGWSAHWEW